MKTTIGLLLLVLFVFGAQAQKFDPKIKTWLDKNIVRLDGNYLKRLEKDLVGNKVLGLAEVSHGTEEVYREKNKIVQHLITTGGYTQIGFEFTDSLFLPLNIYVSEGRGNLRSLLKDFRLYKTEAFYDLFEWIRQYNVTHPEKKVNVFGIDNPRNQNPFTRDSLMAENLFNWQSRNRGKLIVWAHNIHLSRDTSAGYTPLGHYLDKKYKRGFLNIAFDTYEGAVLDMLVDDDGSVAYQKRFITPPTGNFTALFAEQKYDSFYLSFSGSSPFSNLKDSFTFIRVNSSKPLTLPVMFGKDYNALIFIKRTNPAVLLE